MLKKWKWFLVTLVIASMLAGCGETKVSESVEPIDSEENEQVEEAPSESTADEQENGQFPKVVTDVLGDEVTIEQKPERVVSLIPSVTETLFALGEGDYVVGRSDWDNYPEEVLEIESVGDMTFDVERVLSLSPDLVLSHESTAYSSTEGLDQIRSAGIPVVVINDANSIEHVYKAISLIGESTGADQEAADIIDEMKASFAVIEEKAANIPEEEQVSVWIEVSDELYSAGHNTFINEMLQMIQAENIASSESDWPQFTEEQIVSLNPDIIITTYGYYVENSSELVKDRAAWQDVNAVVNDRVYDVNSDEVTRSGPRLVKGVEELAAIIYPEVFGE
ncbi:ABC transporter substrate-binding protein [Bacillus sp. FJAT-45037]|uniref:ABC transporter substrate-binding protein n=1 Tax=Bacillus sp. FJAT-45037 TaxID=2011007 RepID=UPI000C24C915|nr:ABC transporter substrate-binding protein [Bacillus sp. FJAT-45037]